MTDLEAYKLLGLNEETIKLDCRKAKKMVRKTLSKKHPDNGGDEITFNLYYEAYSKLFNRKVDLSSYAVNRKRKIFIYLNELHNYYMEKDVDITIIIPIQIDGKEMMNIEVEYNHNIYRYRERVNIPREAKVLSLNGKNYSITKATRYEFSLGLIKLELLVNFV